MTGNLNAYTPSWLKGLVKPFRRQAVLALALGVASAACGALLMFVSGYLICRTAWPETTLFMVMVPVALVQLFGFGRPFTHYFERLVSHDWVFRVTSALRKRLFQAALAISGDPTDPKSSGEYLEMLADDIGHLQNLYLRVAFPVVIALILLVCACAFSTAFEAILGLCMFGIGVLAAIAMPAFAYLLTKTLQLRAKGLKARAYSQMTDNIMGALDWTLANRGDDAVARSLEASRSLSSAEASVRRRVRLVELLSAIILGLGVVAITCMAADVYQGSAGGKHYIAAFALGMFPLIQVFVQLPGSVSDAPAHRLSINNLDTVLSESGESNLASNGGLALDTIQVPSKPTSNGERISPAAITFSDVAYRYPASASNTLQGLNLQIPVGQKTAIIGQSGSGKTTLAALVRGSIAPDAGSIAVLGAMMPHSSELVSYIPQTSYIFDSTLRENLAVANPQASDSAMLEALASVGLGEKAASLENGLDTHVGETGTGFSGGEAHRVSLARALLSHRPIVVLDEPFSAVDPETERMLLDTLFKAFSDRTLVVITHHLVDIEKFDRVILMSDGTITLDGQPNDLAKSSRHFRELLEFDRASTAFAR